MKIRSSTKLTLASLSALAMSLAWWWPGTWICFVLGWLSAFLFVSALHEPGRPKLAPIYLSGLIPNLLGFYWLFGTIKDFGGFGAIPAGMIFLFFVIVSALQFLICAWFYERLPKILDNWALRSAIAWTSAEAISIRIFPWAAGHTQLGFTSLAQAADLGGVMLISFVMFWLAEVLYQELIAKKRRPEFLSAYVCALSLIIYGWWRLESFREPAGPKQSVLVVQANVSIEDKHNIKLISQNTDRYIQLTKSAARTGDLVVWPETAFSDFMPANLLNLRDQPKLQDLGGPYNILFGVLTFESPERLFNSAWAADSTGRLMQPYHKRILMPFGEYTPFGSVFPWLRDLNATAGGFTPGREAKVFDFSGGANPGIKPSPLICYEDVLPRLASEAVRQGATVLVNLTNDAWFGDTVAPYQHHLIASFRAIENRRYLIRSTNSGLTALVDPTGRTLSALQPFSEGVLRAEIVPLTESTVYSKWLGDWPWWVLGLLVLIYSVLARFFTVSSKTETS